MSFAQSEATGSPGQSRQCHERGGNHESRQRSSARSWPSTAFFKASTTAEIDAAFAAIGKARADALFIAPDGYFASQHLQMATLAARDRIPASDFVSDSVADGLLMSYGTSIPDVFRQAGVYVGSILKGAKPADLPVLQATKFEFAINLKSCTFARYRRLADPPGSR